MSYQIMGILLNTRDQAISTLVSEFVTAGGCNDADVIRDAQANPEQCADELFKEWGAELTGAWMDNQTGEWSHDPEFATRDELIDAITGLDADGHSDE